MSLPRPIARLIKLSLPAFFVLTVVLTAGPAAAAPFPPAARPEGVLPSGEGNAGLVGPRRVVVRDLPPASQTGTVREREVAPPRRVPPASPWPDAPATPPPATNALDSAFSGQQEPHTPPAVSPASFEGLDNNDNGALTGFIVRPPDPQGAVGPTHFFEMINIIGRIYSRTGGTVQSFSLASFFGVPAGWSNFDPKIIYDALSGRWFASYASISNSGPARGRLHLAISQTSDPTGFWNVYYRSYSQVFPDYPGIGVTSDKFTISSNIFNIKAPFYYGVETVVLQKADVMAGVPAADVGLFAFPFNLDRFTVRVAHSLSPVNDQYLVTRSRTVATTLTVIRVTGTPDAGNVTEASATDLTIISQTEPPNSVTAGGATIDSGDYRILDAMWRNGSLWASASAACVPQGDSADRSCAHLVEVDTSSGPPSKVQDIMFGAPAEYFSWPAVRTDASGDVYVSLTHTNSTIFAEARAAGRLASEPVNTMSGSALLRAGDVVHTSDRWGDYLAAAVDPNFPECVWMVGQYAKDNTGISSDWDWGTYIAATSYSGGCDADVDSWTDGAEAVIGTDPGDGCADNPTDAANPADIDNDTFFDITDISALAASFGQSVPPAPARYDIAPEPPDGFVDITDITRIAALFGQRCVGP